MHIGIQLASSILNSERAQAYRIVLLTIKIGLPTRGNQKNPQQIFPEAHFPGNSTFW